MGKAVILEAVRTPRGRGKVGKGARIRERREGVAGSRAEALAQRAARAAGATDEEDVET